MTIHIDHTIVPSRNAAASAKRLAVFLIEALSMARWMKRLAS